MGCIFYFIGAFFIMGGFYVGGFQNILLGIVIGGLFIALGWQLTPHEFTGGIRRKAHSHARIISDTEIEVTNLDDVNAWEMDRWHVSMLKVRTRMGNGTWIYTFDKPMGPLGTQNEQMMYMRNAEWELNEYIDKYINPVKDRLK